MIQRDLHSVLKRASKNSSVISVTGPRQSGKTTLVRAAFPDFQYINFEDLSIREFAVGDPLSFLKTYGNNIIFDEIQHVPELFSYIQVATDENKDMRFILTGSQNLLLHSKISQSLSGRVALFTLLPFSIHELEHTSYARKDYEDFFLTGFYPRIFDEEREPTKWLSDYVQTYLERDVRQISNITDLHSFQQFLKLCAGHVGQTINFSSFGNALGISYHTAQNWLSVLEASYIVFRLYPFHRNFKKRLVKTPKLYFYDTGLASFLLGLKTKEQIRQHFAKGMLFENLIIAELYKSQYNEGSRPDFYFWRDSIGNEVDLIIDQGILQKAVEIKSSRTINNDFFRGLEYWSKLSGSEQANMFLVYGGNARQNRSLGTVVNWNQCSEIIFM
jgi:uncharacterized protein